jgi:poly(3-hydroxybutyrate) depolymerase
MNNRILPKSCDSSWRDLVRPEGLKLCKERIDGWYRTWSEYVPSSYDGSQPVPLVLTVHGAAHHFAETNTAWPLVAEREGFIVVYPHCLVEGIMFNLWRDYDEDGDMPDDIRYFDELLKIIQEKYNIDPERIYIQGQSNGDMMTSTYLFERGNVFAAAAPLSGPSGAYRFVSPETGEIIRAPQFPVPIIRTHGSEDLGGPSGKRGGKSCYIRPEPAVKPAITDEMRKSKLQAHLLIHLILWARTNGCEKLPKLSMAGRYSWLSFPAENGCDLTFYIVEKGEHGPYLDMADNIWTYFFSRYKRVDGKVVRMDMAENTVPLDRGAIALAEGATCAYVNNQRVSLDQEKTVMEFPGGSSAEVLTDSSDSSEESVKVSQKDSPADSAIDESTSHKTLVIGDIFYVPAAFLPTAFPGTELILEDEGRSARLSGHGHEIQMAMGNRVIFWDGHLRDIHRILYYDDTLYVPIADIAALYGMKHAQGRQACYICERGGEMSYDFAYIIRTILGTEPVLTPLDCYHAELPRIRQRDEVADQQMFEELLEKYRQENK